mgnify:CR=1 FL=1
MCDFTHPNFRGVKGNIIMKRDSGIYFKIIPEFHKPTARSLSFMQMMFELSAITTFFEHFKHYRNFTKDDEKQLELIKKSISKRIHPWLEKSNDEIFPIHIE